nr:dTMP kinase [Desulfobulbaceae bacterium]
MKRTGLLIVFEGIDGTGKTTQIRLLAEQLHKRGLDVIATREPTDGTYGQKIRALYSNRNSVTKEEELALFIRDRKEHVERLINPALRQGKVVLTDRYYLSTAAYQGAAGIDSESILKINEEFAPRPDLAIIIELPVEESVLRIEKYRKESLNDFEQEESLRRVSQAFSGMKRDFIRRVDGLKNIDAVHQEIMVYVEQLLE